MITSPENLEYRVKLRWDGKSGGIVNLNTSTLRLDTPVEFGGEGRYPCPDELFFSAIGGCLLTTFLYFRRKLNLPLEGFRISIHGNVDLAGPKGYRITRIRALMYIKTIKNEEANAKKCAELTKDFCHITRTIEKVIPIEISTEVTSTEEKVEERVNRVKRPSVDGVVDG